MYYEGWQSYALDYIHMQTSLAVDEVSEHKMIDLKPQTYMHAASRQAQPASPSCNKLPIELLRRMQYQRGLGKRWASQIRFHTAKRSRVEYYSSQRQKTEHAVPLAVHFSSLPFRRGKSFSYCYLEDSDKAPF